VVQHDPKMSPTAWRDGSAATSRHDRPGPPSRPAMRRPVPSAPGRGSAPRATNPRDAAASRVQGMSSVPLSPRNESVAPAAQRAATSRRTEGA
jgi:hypothetical protein